MSQRERLKELLMTYSYQQREVTLASGRKSNFYFDGKQTTLHPEGSFLVGNIMLDLIQEHYPQTQAVGGPTLGADPIATAIGLSGFHRGWILPAFIVRKEPKGHGTMSWIEGSQHLKLGMRVTLVEDVITSGRSILQACHRVRQAGLHPVGCLVLVDREEGGGEALKKAGLKVISVFNKSQLLNN